MTREHGERLRPPIDATGEATISRPKRLRRRTGGRRKIIGVRLSEDEYERVRNRASALGLSMPRMMLEAVLEPSGGSTAAERADIEELMAIRRLNGAIGRNLNQIARAVNSGALPAPPALDATLEKIADLIARERLVLDAIEALAGQE